MTRPIGLMGPPRLSEIPKKRNYKFTMMAPQFRKRCPQCFCQSSLWKRTLMLAKIALKVVYNSTSLSWSMLVWEVLSHYIMTPKATWIMTLTNEVFQTTCMIVCL